MADFFRQLAELKAGDKLPEELGRAFFSQITAIERKSLIEKALNEQNFAFLVAVTYCGYINAKSIGNKTSADYTSRKGDNDSIDARYFELFVSVAHGCGLGEEELLKMYLACAKANRYSPLYVWRAPSMRKLRMLAAEPEYTGDVRSAIKEGDGDFSLAPLSVDVYGSEALKEYIELAIFGKGINKVALRNFLRDYESEVLKFVESEYPKLKAAEKVTAVRLLLSLKTDSAVSSFLRWIASSETSKSVLKLLIEPQNSKAREDSEFEGDRAKAYLYELMLSGEQIAVSDFIEKLSIPEFSAVADELFFSLYEGGDLIRIFVTDNGVIYDLLSNVIELPEAGAVSVSHPLELRGPHESVKRWNINQPFLQLNRKIYMPNDMDRFTGSYRSIAGTTVLTEKFVVNMHAHGFRALNYRSSGIFDCVGLRRGGIWCVLFTTPVDTANKQEGSVQAKCVRFYYDSEVIKIGHNVFVDEVEPIMLSDIDARVFSEFIYSVYKLMGCE